MAEDDARALASNKRRRGVAMASITRLDTSLSKLERTPIDRGTLTSARRLMTKLEALDKEFKSLHLAVVDLTTEGSLPEEQRTLDNHDEQVSLLEERIHELIDTCQATADANARKVPLKYLAHIQKTLDTLSDDLLALPDDSTEAVPLLHQYSEQLSELKGELGEVRKSLYSMDLEDTDPLCQQQSRIDKAIFTCSVKVKKSLSSHEHPTTTAAANPHGVKLPKLDVATFDGNILHWKTFWEQFEVSVHNRPSLSDAEKLVYLRHALKDGIANRVIEGLSRSGEHYEEALECLRSRYDKPRLIHQTHVRMILESPSLKDGTGKELRRLHDTAQQHLRALKGLGHDPPGPFITSLLELKLDPDTMFEWQRHSQANADVPHYNDLLEFINLRAQASESSSGSTRKQQHGGPRHNPPGKPVASFVVNTNPTGSNCVCCKKDKHPLYLCAKFRGLSHEDKVSTLKSNGICLNCLRPGHYIKDCNSSHKCKRCQKPHHTLLHIETKEESQGQASPATPTGATPISTNATMGIHSNLLLMTCNLLVEAPDGSTTQARAILDSASSASFISEHLTQKLGLPRSKQDTRISGVAGLSSNSSSRGVADFRVSSLYSPHKKFDVTALVVSKVTCDLPPHPILYSPKWTHLPGLALADPEFGTPGRIDILLGVDIFVNVLLDGRRSGPPGSPVAFETQFGWVLAGNASSLVTTHHITNLHTLTGDDLIRQFWEVEEKPLSPQTLTPEEQSSLDHFKAHHTRSTDGRFVVPLPRKPGVKDLGESRSQAVHRFFSFERTLHAKGLFQEFSNVIEEYFTLGHAEEVPLADMNKPPQEVFYLPMHSVHKESSTTTKVRAVFDASAKTSSGVSLNDTLLVGPTVHSSLVDVLLRFRLHRVALTADVSKMYRAIALTQSDKDFHRFVWRCSPQEPLKDFRMTRVTFGVSASSFVANMCVKQNAIDYSMEFPLAAKAVSDAFYVDDGVTGASSVSAAVRLHRELQSLFSNAGFLLRKWNSSEPSVLQQIDSSLRDSQSVLAMSTTGTEYTKTLGIEWSPIHDHFRITVADVLSHKNLTKRALVSDIARTFDVLGWFSPTIVKMKILLQRLWEEKVSWDDPVPPHIQDVWSQWREEICSLSAHSIPRPYFPKGSYISSLQLHGFSDASELAFAGVVYLCMTDTDGNLHTSLVISKTKVAPIKRISIPRLELCGADLLAQLLHHCKEVFNIAVEDVFAWTDSTIVLNWLVGNPRRFKTYVGNRVSRIIGLVPPERWRHVVSKENPADCASRGLFPCELLEHKLWWSGPSWLKCSIQEWPKQPQLATNPDSVEDEEVCLHLNVVPSDPIVSFQHFSSYTRTKRVVAWVFRFTHNCRARKKSQALTMGPLTVQEMNTAESHLVSCSQATYFADEIHALKSRKKLPRTSPLLPLNPFLDGSGLLRVGGREHNSKLPYNSCHPLIIHARDSLARLQIQSEHLRLLHAGPLLLTASLSRRFRFIKGRSVIRSITRSCVTCRRKSARPQRQMMGRLPAERVTPDSVFNNVGVDYAGPIYIKLGTVRRPTIVKAYIAVFVSLSVKAVHLEAVSDLTAEAFLACLRRFIARRGKPQSMWSDHGTNFVGATRLLAELFQFLRQQDTKEVIADFCSSQNIRWNLIPEHAPHFGGLWEAAVKSMKLHLSRIVGNAKLTFEELTTVLAQIESCLNSRPLALLTCDDDGIEPLTPGHFLIGRPLEALPDPASSYRPLPLLRRWDLCQTLVRHFWQRWSLEYLTSLQKLHKWHHPSRNVRVGDVVLLREDSMVPAQWPMARVIDAHPGQDGLVRVITVKTSKGTYTRPVAKVSLLLPEQPCES